MSRSELGSSVCSSPSSSVLKMMSPKAPSSPDTASAHSVCEEQSSQSAQALHPSTSSTVHGMLQAKSMGVTLSDTATRLVDVTSAPKQSPECTLQEAKDEEVHFEHTRKYRATSLSESVVAATPSVKHATPSKTKATTRAARPQPPVSNVNRPSRARRPPKEFCAVDEREQTIAKKAVQAKRPVSKVFDPGFITSNSTSRLGKADIYHMLLEDLAWTSLNRDQQRNLLSMLPPCLANQEALKEDMAIDEDIGRPHAFTLSNDCFRTDVAKFKEDLKNGHLAKTWQAAAEQAVVERAAGEYDEWKAEEAEAWWGQKGK